MAIRVDHQGYLIDYQGKRLSAQEGNDAASVAKRWQQVLAAWQKNKPGDKDGPDKGITTMQVENGDCQWNVFGGAGANEYRDYRTVNKHIDNPDLIYKGQILFVDKTTRLSQSRNGRDEGKDNIDIFRDQQQAAAEGGASPTDLSKDAAVFMATTPDEIKGGVFPKLFESPPDTGDTSDGIALNRRAAAAGYLLSLGADAPTGLKDLQDLYNKTPPEDKETARGYNTAITQAATDLGLAPKGDTGTGNTGNGTGNVPAGVVLDDQGKEITDPVLLRINTAATNAGGKTDDANLKGEIARFLNVDSGTPEEVAGRVTQLSRTNFGANDYKVNDYIVRYLPQEMRKAFKDIDDWDALTSYVETVLKALPNKDTQQRVMNALMTFEYDVEEGEHGTYYMRDLLEDVDGGMGLTADVGWSAGDVTINTDPIDIPADGYPGTEPTTNPTDASGKAVTDEALLNINTAAARSGGNPNDPDLRKAIGDYLKLGSGTSEEKAKTLRGFDFGAYDYQVNDYLARYATTS